MGHYTPVSPEPLYGGKGYLSVVHLMRQGFSNVQWKLQEMVAENNMVAVRWTCSGTHDGEFMGLKAYWLLLQNMKTKYPK